MSEQAKKDKVDIFKHKFGIEIEMTGISKEKAAQVLQGYFKFGKGPFYAEDARMRMWKITTDGSITVEGKSGEAVEFITPILKYKDIKTLKEVIVKLREAGAMVNDSCGLHIHLDGRVHTTNSIKRLIGEIICYQDLICNALKVSENRIHYCKKLDPEDLKKMIKLKPITFDEIHKIASSKYRILNLCNISNRKNKIKNTIEFRLFNSTLDENEVEAYIKLCLALSTQAINGPDIQNPKMEHVKSNQEMPQQSIIAKVFDTFKIAIVDKIKEYGINRSEDIQKSKVRYKQLYGISKERSYFKARSWLLSLGLDSSSIEQLTKNLSSQDRNNEKAAMSFI